MYIMCLCVSYIYIYIYVIYIYISYCLLYYIVCTVFVSHFFFMLKILITSTEDLLKILPRLPL